jgi:arylsulfatase
MSTLTHLGSLALAGTLAWGAERRPDIVVILLDDMGFSDLGCFGSTLPTPHIDALAAGGMRLTRFYAQPACAPTRAALMSGLYPQRAGVGINLARFNDPFWPQVPSPAYQSFRSEDTITIAELLRGVGYRTYMTGKWHLGDEPGRWPAQRGFDRSFALIHGMTDSNWLPKWAPYALDDQPFTAFPADFYTTDAFADRALEFIRATPAGQPFFCYLSFNAPHTPHEAPAANLARVTGRLDLDPAVERQRRLERQIELGLFPAGTELGACDAVDGNPDRHPPEVLRGWFERYAAMIDRVDEQVGRVVAELRALGRLDNTLIVLASDNGATPPWFGERWAEVSNTPYRLMKGTTHEGGIHVPCIVHWPARTPAGTINQRQVGHVMDLLPTFAAAAGVTVPMTYAGRQLATIDGRNLLPAWTDPRRAEERTLCWEMSGCGAIRMGDWKLVRTYRAPEGGRRASDCGPRTGAWELYDLARDPVENHDLAASEPERVASMTRAYHAWEATCRVLDWQDIVARLDRFRAANPPAKPKP